MSRATGINEDGEKLMVGIRAALADAGAVREGPSAL